MGDPALPQAVGGTPTRAVDPLVFGCSSAIVLAVLAYALLDRDGAQALFAGTQDWIVTRFGDLLLVAVVLFLLGSLAVAFSPLGRIRLAADADAATEFPTWSWLSMLFSAGMGIGLLFYGVAEPVTHYAAPPQGGNASEASARVAMQISLFHWGLHAWGIYAVTGLALAYFHHRRGLPLAMRSTLSPLLGAWTDRWPGKIVDVLAVFGTLFGLATSLGLGAMQINAGLAHLLGVPEGLGVQLVLIAGITALATLSLVSGLGRGIRRLSELNVGLAVLLWAFVLVAGPTAAVLGWVPGLVGAYLVELPALSFGGGVLGDLDWQKGNTLFYWAWWISWAPFVGIFVARISRGRSVRSFVLGVVIVPTVATLLWFTVLGGTALEAELRGAGGIAEAVQANVATAIYALLSQLPLAELASAVAAIVVALFFVTSSDSGSYVVDTLTSGGHPDPPVWQRVFWASIEGAIAAVLLSIGGLGALQAAAINTGLPFCLALLVAGGCLVWALWTDPHR